MNILFFLCIKGASTMGVGLKRLVNKRYTTLLFDEYNTSKKCNITIDGNKKFRLLGCKHCRNDKEEHIGSPEDDFVDIRLKEADDFVDIRLKEADDFVDIRLKEADEPKSMFQSYRFFTRDKNNLLGIVKHMIYNKNKRPTEFIRG